MHVLVRASLIGLVVAGAGCSRGEGSAAPAPSGSVEAPARDRHADGKAIAAERARWKENWKAVPELPSCADLELGADEKALCTKASSRRDALRALEQGDPPAAELLDAALALALDSTAAWNALRSRGVTWMIDDLERRDGGAPRDPHDHGHDTPPPAASGPKGAVGAMPGTGHVAADPNPWSGHVKAYLATAGLGMGRITAHLRLAPVPVRREALARLETFLAKYPDSRTGINAVNDAFFGEQDPEIRERLGKMRDAASARVKRKR